jgi:hypothetical protein
VVAAGVTDFPVNRPILHLLNFVLIECLVSADPFMET